MRTASLVALVSLSMVAATEASAQRSTVGQKPPKGAVVLFDGKDVSQWVHRGSNNACQWEIVDGAIQVKTGTGDLVTKQEFGDYRLHIEFWLPLMADQTSQARAKSGVYNHGRYEIQVLDSYNNPTYKFGGCGALYGLKDPDKDAIKPPEQWNTYDITFRAPRFDKDGKLTENPRVTVVHNGVKIHDNVEITVPVTTAGLPGNPLATGPLLLQDHGNRVRYRNIWIVPAKK